MIIRQAKIALLLLCFAANTLFAANYATNTPYWDNIGAILTSMGYPFTELLDSSLSIYSNISARDVLFLNCSPNCSSNAPGAKNNLNNYVDGGGIIYASDWAYIYLQTSFGSDKIKFYNGATIGDSGQYICQVTDEGLRDYIGASSIELNLNLSGWVPIESVATATKVYLSGNNDSSYPSQVAGKPMLVSFKSGKGTVIFTTFHNEAQLSSTQTRLMEYMVLMAITSQLSDELAQNMQDMGYVVAKENLNKINLGESPSYTYTHNTTGGYDLAFGIHWNNGSIKLDVYKPDGSLYSSQQSASPPLIIEAPKAATGEWRYTITAITLPSSNEPYVTMAARRTMAAENLENIIIAPNPFKPSRGDTVMVFDNIPSIATLRIFSPDGQLIRTIEKSDSSGGSIFWDVKNDSGGNVSSGIYIYVITDSSGNKKKGKLAIIR